MMRGTCKQLHYSFVKGEQREQIREKAPVLRNAFSGSGFPSILSWSILQPDFLFFLKESWGILEPHLWS